jgi:vacuolar protein sorting-associated protein 13A/C
LATLLVLENDLRTLLIEVKLTLLQMWEGIVSTLISRYLGDYIEGLTKENLHLSLLSGNVELKNLKFHKDVFHQMELPLFVQTGSIQKIQITIPWTQLASKPSHVLIDGIVLVVSPMDPNKVS